MSHSSISSPSRTLTAATLTAVGAFLTSITSQAEIIVFEPASPISGVGYSDVISWTPDALSPTNVGLSGTGPLNAFGCNGLLFELSQVGDNFFDTRVILMEGDLISSSSMFSGSVFATSGFEGFSFYIGYGIAIGPNTHYGWAEFSYNRLIIDDPRPLLDLKRWAYETTPETAIAAGATAIPEPASITLMLGAVTLGLVASTRRRRVS